MPNIILSDGSLSPTSWNNWIYDILKFNTADPTFPRKDSTFFDPIDDARNYLVDKKTSPEKFDEAIFKAIMERVDLNLVASDNTRTKEIARLIDFLQYDNVKALAKVFFSRKYNNAIGDEDGWHLKAYILRCLAYAKLSTKQAQNILLKSRNMLSLYKMDIVYWTNLLRFSRTQFKTHREFFKSLTRILNCFSEEEFTETIRFNLKDQLQEFKYFNFQVFENGVKEWVSSLLENPVTISMKEIILEVKKYKSRAKNS